MMLSANVGLLFVPWVRLLRFESNSQKVRKKRFSASFSTLVAVRRGNSVAVLGWLTLLLQWSSQTRKKLVEAFLSDLSSVGSKILAEYNG